MARADPSEDDSLSGSEKSSYSRSESKSASESRSATPSESESADDDSRSPPPPKKSGTEKVPRTAAALPVKKAAVLDEGIEEPVVESRKLHIGCLTRNVTEDHLKEIFGLYGDVASVELAVDKQVNLPKGFGYVEFKTRIEAEKAQQHMDGGQIDGNVVSATFVLVPRVVKRRSPPPRGPILPSGSNRGREGLPKVPSDRRDDRMRIRGDEPEPWGSRARERDRDKDREREPSRRSRESPTRRRPLPPARRPSPSPPPRGRNRSPVRPAIRRGDRRTPPARHLSPISYRRRSPVPPLRRRTSPAPPRRVRSRTPPSRRPPRSRSPQYRSGRPRSPPTRRARTPPSSPESDIPARKKVVPRRGGRRGDESESASKSESGSAKSESV